MIDSSGSITSNIESETAANPHTIKEFKEVRILSTSRCFKYLSTIKHAAIVEERKNEEIKTSEQLKRVLKRFLNHRKENKVLAQIYQAIRIEVNQEIEVLKDLAKKLGDSQITVFNEKLDNFEVTLQKHQEILLKNLLDQFYKIYYQVVMLNLVQLNRMINQIKLTKIEEEIQ